ncbi:hypothetical protein V865_004548 [Kwoniella europaea PYCC6329]|uniref:GPI inositol-deacylase n=1 Tax=Kwoniella europaea PYCC6329 TaxID=1423913 RepID=A0AAX4KM75_9TREE
MHPRRPDAQHGIAVKALETAKSRSVTSFSALLGVLFIWIVYHFYQRDLQESGSWGCEMSWMSPSYQLVEWQDNPIPRYQVYLYREQGLEMESSLIGHPVIFIPGNAGSYQQVRSIASSAVRQYREQSSLRQGTTKLDFFTIDFKEDFSAFHARTLSTQADFIRHAVRRILAEYNHLPSSERPAQVTLLAHSMGGIASRLAVTVEDISSSVDAILTMSTPHLTPPLTIEWNMEQIYQTISHPIRPLLISLCGGISDTQVVSDSCALPSTLLSEDDGFATFTTGIPGVWTGVDHQAIVWCQQVRYLIAKTLLQMASIQSRIDKLSIARSTFLGDYSLRSSHVDTHSFPITSTGMTVIAEPKTEDSHIDLAVQHCTDKCRDIPLTHSIVPRPRNTNAPFPLPGEGVKRDEKLLVVDVGPRGVDGVLEVHTDSHRIIEAGSRKVMTSQTSTWRADDSSRNATSLTLSFPKCRSSSLLVHKVRTILTGCCDGLRPIIQHVSIPSYPFQNVTSESRSYPNTKSGQSIFLHSHVESIPFQTGESTASGVTLRIIQQSDCRVEQLQISLDTFGILAKIVTRYRMTFLSWPLGWIAVVMLMQLQVLRRDGRFPSFGDGLEQVGRHWLLGCCVLLGVVNIVQACLGTTLHLNTLMLGTIDLALLPLVIFMALWTFSLTCVAWFGVLFTNASLRTMVLRAFGRGSQESNHTINTHPSRSVFLMCLIMVLVYLFIPHQLVFVVSVAVLWASLIWKDRIDISDDFGNTILFLMIFLLPFKATTLLVWGRSLWTNWQHPLSIEHNILYVGPAVLLTALCAGGSSPKQKNITIQICRMSLFTFAIIAFSCGSRWTWMLLPIAHIVLLTLVGMIW